jgi:hypothetical protein
MKPENIKDVVDHLIIKHARKEALQIMTLANPKEVKEFFAYYKKKNFNVCCLVIDKIKQRLVADGILKQRKSDHFGHPYY